MAGFSLDLLKTVEEKYICQHCHLILRDPVQTSCGHRYCKECFQGLIRDDDNICCSACINEGCLDSLMNAEQMFPDRAISRELNEKTVRCINDGCDWTGLFKLYQEEHFDSCQYSVIACLHRNGCDKYIQRRNLTRHLGDECVMRMVRCPHCDAEMVYKEFQEHLDSCPKCQVSCTFCGEILTREQIQKHTDDEDGDCPRMPLPCDFRCVGCIEMVEKEKMDDHKKRHLGQHLVMLMETLIPFLTVLRTEKDSFTEVADLKKSVQRQAEKISSLQTNLKEVRDWSEDIRVRQRRQEEKLRNSQDYGENIKVLERAIDELKHSFEAFGIKVSVNEGVTAVLRDEVEKLSGLIQSLFEHQRENGVRLKALERRIKAQDRIIAAKDVVLAEQDIRIQALEMASYDGVLLWKITNFNRKRNDAVSRRATSIYSPCFHTSRHGYKMCARVYLNGDGMGLGNHVSLFFVIMKGPYDALLRWPFRQKVTFEWLDQSGGEHVVDAFRPDPNSSSFQRPVNDMNIASGCPLFLPLSHLDSPRNLYVKDDAAFIKISVDVSNLI